MLLILSATLRKPQLSVSLTRGYGAVDKLREGMCCGGTPGRECAEAWVLFMPILVQGASVVDLNCELDRECL